MEELKVVSGGVSTVADLGKDEAWLQEWLSDEPARLGLGELDMADADPVKDEDGNPAFLASDDDNYFSVNVRLGEMDASHGFQVLDNWARNRVRHPDRTHVAVLVTDTASERYRTTLETLAEHLPLVVVELTAWRGETEAILVPRVVLSSDDVDLSATPGVAAAEASPIAESYEVDDEAETAETTEPETAGADGADAADEAPVDKDDTGVEDPWKLPKRDSETIAPSDNGSLAGVAND